MALTHLEDKIRLMGQMILEVPVQNDSRISPKVLQVARELNIIIRDINGKGYK